MTKKTKDKIIDSAARLIHERGYDHAGLYDVAKDLGLKQAHIFYHFKTKQALAIGVLERYARWTVDDLKRFDVPTSPRKSIANFIKGVTEYEDVYAWHGCPIANLTSALTRDLGEAADDIAGIYLMQLTWLTDKYVQLGLTPAKAKRASTDLLINRQGAIHLSHVLGQPKVLRDFTRAQQRQLGEITQRPQ